LLVGEQDLHLAQLLVEAELRLLDALVDLLQELGLEVMWAVHSLGQVGELE